MQLQIGSAVVSTAAFGVPPTAAIALAHQSASGICRPIRSARRWTERPGRSLEPDGWLNGSPRRRSIKTGQSSPLTLFHFLLAVDRQLDTCVQLPMCSRRAIHFNGKVSREGVSPGYWAIVANYPFKQFASVW